MPAFAEGIAQIPVIGLRDAIGSQIEVETIGGLSFNGVLRSADKFNNLIIDGAAGDAALGELCAPVSLFVRGAHIARVRL